MLDDLPLAFWAVLAVPVLIVAVAIFASRGQPSRRGKNGGDGGASPYAADTGSDGGCGGDGGGGGD